MLKNISKPIAKLLHDAGSSNIGTAAWVQLSAALEKPCAAIEVFNSTGEPLLLATGAAASEVELPYYIIPGGSSAIIPIQLKAGVRLSAKSAGSAATSGLLIFNFLQ